MALIGRITLIAALVAAPWWFGGVTPQAQWSLCVIIVGLLTWRLVEALVRPPEQPFHVPTAVLAPIGLLIVATIQLLPRDDAPIARMEHAVLADSRDAFADAPRVGSVAPATTRTQISLLFLGVAAFFLGAQWFADGASQIWLWRLLAVNGAALGFFGIVQQLTWNGMLYWSVPRRLGGTPFASFVNRNNAAGYLNLCLAAGLGWLIYRLAPTVASHLRSQARGKTATIPWKARTLRRIANVDGLDLGVMGLVILIATALLCSLSRGGIVAMAIGAVVVIWRQRGLSRLALLAILGFFSLATIGTISWVGGWDAVQNRLSSLSDPAAAAEGRLAHWWDTSGAVLDFPMLGTGLGTYKYANLPYQVHAGDAWYMNADNHLFEMLVETGGVGFGLYVIGFVMTGIAAVSLMHRDQAPWRTAGVVGLFALVTQFVQAFTDFGLLIPSNALTFAVISGAVCGAACSAASFEKLHVPWWLGLASLEQRWSQALLSLVLMLASFAFGLEIYASTRATAARNVSVEIRPARPLETRPEYLAAVIENAENKLTLRPDDPELHRALGLWWIDRYRLEAARELNQLNDSPKGLNGHQLWQATSVSVLNSRATAMEQQGERAQLDRLRQLPIVREHLLPAREHLRQAARFGPLTRDVSRHLADLAFLADDHNNAGWTAEMKSDLTRALFIEPSSPQQLFIIGMLAETAGLQSVADLAYRRCLTVSEEHLMPVWSVISDNRPVEELLNNVIPARVQVLVTLAEAVSEKMTKSTLANRASRLLKEEAWEDDEEPSHLLQARLLELQGQTEGAVRHYKLAFSDHKMEIEARLRLAQLLTEEQRFSEAESELLIVQGLAGDRQDVQRRINDLKLRRLGELLESRE